MSAMTFDSSPIPGALVPRGSVPFGQHQKERRICDRERIPGHEIVFAQRMLIGGGGRK